MGLLAGEVEMGEGKLAFSVAHHPALGLGIGGVSHGHSIQQTPFSVPKKVHKKGQIANRLI